MVYRSWSSLRAKECLRHLSNLVDQHEFGFLPGREATQVWFTLQAYYLEVCILAGQDRCGWITDIQKAFENIPRDPICWLALKLGTGDRSVVGLFSRWYDHAFSAEWSYGRCTAQQQWVSGRMRLILLCHGPGRLGVSPLTQGSSGRMHR